MVSYDGAQEPRNHRGVPKHGHSLASTTIGSGIPARLALPGLFRIIRGLPIGSGEGLRGAYPSSLAFVRQARSHGRPVLHLSRTPRRTIDFILRRKPHSVTIRIVNRLANSMGIGPDCGSKALYGPLLTLSLMRLLAINDLALAVAVDTARPLLKELHFMRPDPTMGSHPNGTPLACSHPLASYPIMKDHINAAPLFGRSILVMRPDAPLIFEKYGVVGPCPSNHFRRKSGYRLLVATITGLLDAVVTSRHWRTQISTLPEHAL